MSHPSYPGDPALHSPNAMTGAYPPAALPERRGVFAGFSNIEREGSWMVPRYFDTDPS